MDGELTTIVSQFGAAGLMGMLWILERRHAALRDRQLTEAHRGLAAREHELAAMLGVVRDNTRAIVTLEKTQERLLRTAERLNERLARWTPMQPSANQPSPRASRTTPASADAA